LGCKYNYLFKKCKQEFAVAGCLVLVAGCWSRFSPHRVPRTAYLFVYLRPRILQPHSPVENKMVFR